MSFGETKGKVKEMLKNQREFNKYYNDGGVDRVRNITNFMINTMEDVKNGGTVKIGEQDKTNVLNVTNMLIDTLLNEKLTDFILDFCKLYSLILSNWNDNIVNSDEIERKAKMMNRLANGVESIDDLIKKVKNLRVEREEKQSMRLAQHYLETLGDKDDSN